MPPHLGCGPPHSVIGNAGSGSSSRVATGGRGQRPTTVPKEHPRKSHGAAVCNCPRGGEASQNEAVRSRPTCRTRSTRTSSVEMAVPGRRRPNTFHSVWADAPVCSDTPVREVDFVVGISGEPSTQSTQRGEQRGYVSTPPHVNQDVGGESLPATAWPRQTLWATRPAPSRARWSVTVVVPGRSLHCAGASRVVGPFLALMLVRSGMVAV